MRIIKKITITLVLLNSTIIYCQENVKNQITLKTKDYFVLQENDSVVISSISNIQYSPNGKYFIVNSNSNPNEIYIFNTEINGIYKIIKAKDNLTDSLIEKTKPYFDSLIYLPMSYALFENLFNKDKFNDFKYGLFINDSIIYINSIIRSFNIPKTQGFDNYNRRILNMNVCLIKYNIFNDNYQVLPCGDTLYRPYNQGKNLIVDKQNNIIYSIVRSGKKQLESNMTPAVISRYDDNFKYIEDAFSLPEEYIKTKLNYSINYNPELLINSKNELIALFPFVEKVYNISKKSSFEIKNLNKSNKVLFDKLIADENLLKKIIDSIYYHLPNYLSKIYETNNEEYIIYIVEAIANDTSSIKPFIQLYDLDGKFKASLNLEYQNKNGKLKYFHYSKIDNKIRMFRLNDDNWIVEEYDWRFE
jgi:hypothetical protein